MLGAEANRRRRLRAAFYQHLNGSRSDDIDISPRSLVEISPIFSLENKGTKSNITAEIYRKIEPIRLKVFYLS